MVRFNSGKFARLAIATHHIFKRFQAIAIFAIIEMCELHIVLCPKI
ncbi:hypothetical protein [Pseudanabaena minima]